MATRFRTVIRQLPTGDPAESWDIVHNLGEDDVTVTIRPSSPPVGAVVSIPYETSNRTTSSLTLIPYVDQDGNPVPLPAGYYVVQVVPTGAPL